MKEYLETMMEQVENSIDLPSTPGTAKAIAEAKEILSDENSSCKKECVDTISGTVLLMQKE